VTQTLTYVGSTYFDRLPGGATSSVELDVTTTDDLGGLFRAISRSTKWDVAEFSLSNYLTLRGNGDERYIALPVFPSRSFRHSQIYVSSSSGIAEPSDLRGRRVAIPEYHMTAGVWMRAFLEADFGVRPAEIEWVTPSEALAYVAEVDFPLPADVRFETVDESLDVLLARGDVDALFTVTAPPSFADPSSPVQRLFPDYRAVEEDYFQRTGFFPIMHAVVLAENVYRANPELAVALVELFQRAKEAGIARLTNLNAVAIVDPWVGADLDRVVSLFGGDPFTYGIPANRATLGAMLEYHYGQGLTRRKLAVEDVFASETLAWEPATDLLATRRW
jgi:4,5-dihydroxyphthalate decarboxylase